MRTALYRFFDADGELLYVGITHRLNDRITEHKKQRAWDQVARIDVEHYDDRFEAELAEVRAIREGSPAWNVAHNDWPTLADELKEST